MPHSLHSANFHARGFVCGQHNDTRKARLYLANMAKRSRPVIPVTWYLREWMDALKVNQAYMIKHAGWSKTTASLLYNCQQDMNVDLLKSAAAALGRKHYELLMPPEDAFQIIRHRQEIEREALKLVADRKVEFAAKPETDDLVDRKAAGGGKG